MARPARPTSQTTSVARAPRRQYLEVGRTSRFSATPAEAPGKVRPASRWMDGPCGEPPSRQPLDGRTLPARSVPPVTGGTDAAPKPPSTQSLPGRRVHAFPPRLTGWNSHSTRSVVCDGSTPGRFDDCLPPRVRPARTGIPIEAIIFDCDGTLVDSLPLAAEVLVECLASFGVVLSVQDAYVRFGSGRLSESMAAFERGSGVKLPADFVPELRQRRDRAVPERLRPLVGARELVSSLRMPIAVASNGPLQQTLLSLEVTGLLGHF